MLITKIKKKLLTWLLVFALVFVQIPPELFSEADYVAGAETVTNTGTGITSYDTSTAETVYPESENTPIVQIENNLLVVMLTAPSNLVVVAQAGDLVTLAWEASQGGSGSIIYEVYRDGSVSGTTMETTYTDTGLSVGNTYIYTVKAYDESGNVSAASNEISVVIRNEEATEIIKTPEIPAQSSLSAPSNLVVSSQTHNSVSLTWGASTGGIGSVIYEVYRNGDILGNTSETTFSDTALQAGLTYVYLVKACDGAGNISEASNEVTVTIPFQVPFPPAGVPLAAGISHSLVIKKDGTVWAWGNNESGQLGDGTCNSTVYPVNVKGLKGIVSVAVGDGCSFALDGNGQVWAWGAGDYGQLGNGTYIGSNIPVQVLGLEGITAVGNCWALKNDGTVWFWGYDNGNVPVQVAGLADVADISSTGYGVTVLKRDGTVWRYYAGGVSEQLEGFSGIVDISVGDNHILALKDDGTVWAMGDNWYGQLGDGTNEYTEVPVQVKGLTGVSAVAAGSNHSIALKSDGTVWAWGENESGQLGNGTLLNSSVPVCVQGLVGVTAVAAGYNYSLAVKEDGLVRAWGDNQFGQLGDGTNDSSSVPVTLSVDNQPPYPPCGLRVVTSTSDSVTLAWEASADYMGVAGYEVYRDGEKIGTVNSTNFIDEAVQPGAVYVYTVRAFDEAGNMSEASNPTSNDSLPPSMPLDLNASQITGSTVSLSWTASTDNHIVKGYRIYRDGIAVGETASTTYTDKGLLAGKSYSYVVKAFDMAGNLSEPGNEITVTTIPLYIKSVSLAAGFSHSLKLNDDGTLSAWGGNNYGQLGNGAETDSTIPVLVKYLNQVVSVSTGNHTVALNRDGTVWAFGENEFGQLGNGGLVGSNVPVQTTDMNGVVAVAAGGWHSLAVKEDGTVWAWGQNSSGELGNGSLDRSNIPVQVRNLTGVTAVAGGDYHSLALKEDGTVWAWGGNLYGQLGDGSTSDSSVPVQVQGLTGITAVDGGNDHSLALKDDGTVWAWGNNHYGQLGNETLTGSNVPVQVHGLTGVIAIAAGSSYSLALKKDGTVWAWGYNSNGQLGDGTTVGKTVPIQVRGLTGVIAIAAGGAHSLALKEDGTVWAWGNNYNGQLGNGKNVSSNVPILVSGDTDPPAAPTGLVVNSTPTSARLRWEPSQDNIGVAGYEVYRNGIKVCTVATTTYQDNNLDPGGNYEYSIKAFDAAGNVSDFSKPATRDYDPPLAPGNLSVESKTMTAVCLKWDQAADNNGVTGYIIYRDRVEAGRSAATTYADTGLIPGVTYNYTVKAYDAGENLSPESNVVGVTTVEDHEPPSMPGNLYFYYDDPEVFHASVAMTSTYNLASSQPAIVLMWDNSTDNAGVAGYEVFRNGVKLQTVTDDFYADTGYHTGDSYAVRSIDVAGNVSEFSNTVVVADDYENIRTNAFPISLGSEVGGTINYNSDADYFSFNTAAEGDYVVEATVEGSILIELYDSISSKGKTAYAYTGNTGWDTVITKSLSGNRTYYLKVLDNYSHIGNYKIKVHPADSCPPAAPGGLSVVETTPVSISLTWSPSTDDYGVAGYRIYKDGEVAGDTGSVSYTVYGLTPNKNYFLAVSAFDLAGNLSPEATVHAVTGGDNEPPTIPESLEIVFKTGNNVTIGWSPSSDNIGLAGYDIYRNGVKISSNTGTGYKDSGLDNGTYTYAVKAVDLAGNESGFSNEVTIIINEDNQAPTPPANLTATGTGETYVSLEWDASTDNIGVQEYYIYRDGRLAGISSANYYSDGGLAPGTTYQYTVKARDAAGNLSDSSNTITATTLADTTAPGAPGNLTVTRSATFAKLYWAASSDNAGVAGYDVFRNDVKIGTTSSCFFTDTSFDKNIINTYYVKAKDQSGNISPPSNSVIFELIPPSVPRDLAVYSKTGSGVVISWTASTDNVGISGYEVYRDGVKIGNAAGTTYADSGLMLETSYSYTVKAVDTCGNLSAASSPLTVTTDKDIQPPTVPAGLVQAAYTGSSVTVRWTASTDDVRVDGYEIYRDGVKVGQTQGTNFTDSGLTAGTSYTYTVKAFDASGNQSGPSDPLTVTPQMPQIIRVDPVDGAGFGGAGVQLLKIYFKDSGDTGENLVVDYSLEGGLWSNTGFAISGPVSYDSKTKYFNCKWDLSSLVSGQYALRFTLLDSNKNSIQQISNYIIDRTAPTVPQDFLAKPIAGGGGITLTWLPVADLDVKYYQIYRMKEGTDSFIPLTKVYGESSVSYTDKAVQAGISYYYELTAVDKYGQESNPATAPGVVAQADTICPVVLNIVPRNGSGIGKQATITVNAGDNLKMDAITLQYSVNGGNEWVDIATASSTGKSVFNWNTEGLTGEVNVRAIAVDAAGNSSDGSPVMTYTIDHQGPGKIEGLTATPDSNSVILRWNDSQDQDLAYFQVEKKTSPEGQYEPCGTTSIYLGLNVTGLTMNTDYWFRVVGYDWLGNRGEPSDEIYVRTTADNTPPYLTRLGPGSSRYSSIIHLIADANDNSKVCSVNFQYSMDQVQWTDIGSIMPKADSRVSVNYDWDVTSLQEGTYYVRAVVADDSGNNNISTTPVLEYIIDHTGPVQPVGVTITPTSGYIQLSWQKCNETDLAGYRVYRSVEENGTYQMLGQIQLTEYCDRNVDQGVTYYYRISAFDIADNEGPECGTVSGKLLADNESPRIISISPSSGKTLPANPTIRVLASDNYRLSQVKLEYRTGTDPETWQTISNLDINSDTEVATFNWDTSGLRDGNYVLRAVAVDASGYSAVSGNIEYKLNIEGPAVPEVTITPGGCSINLSWTGGNDEDFSEFRIYRKEVPNTGQLNVETNLTGETPDAVDINRASGGQYNAIINDGYKLVACTPYPSYNDGPLPPGYRYFYVVEAVDCYGNSSFSPAVNMVPGTGDPYPPTANAGEDQIVTVGMEVCFDGTLSSDNTGIDKYEWDFGDGTRSDLARPVHIYREAGSYEVVLNVYDPQGNSATDSVTVSVLPANREISGLDINVLDNDTGLMLVGASVVVEGELGTRQKFYTDENGYVHTVTVTGKCKVYAYIKDYLPKEVDTVLQEGKINTVIVRLEKGQLVKGEFQVKRLTLEEIKNEGVDITAPQNQFVYQYKINNKFYLINGEGDFINGRPENVQVIPHPKHPEVEPAIAYLNVPVDVIWLKEFFEVGLTVTNMADSQFVIDQSKVHLDLPDGLSLADTNGSQSLDVELGAISGRSSAEAKWIIKGDKKGDYNLKASFDGLLQPFGDSVRADFVTDEPVRVWGGDALEMEVSVEDFCFKDEPFQILIDLKNVSDHDVYNITIMIEEGKGYSISGKGTQSVSVLKAGETASFTFIILPSFTGIFNSSNLMLNSSGEQIKTTFKTIPSARKKYHQPDDSNFDSEFLEGDPVDMASGAHLIERRLLSLNGVMPLELTAKYNSQLLNTGPMGRGWDHGFSTRLEEIYDGNIIVYWSPNQWNVFYKDSNNYTYSCPDTSFRFDSLVKNEDGTYTLTRKDLTVYQFNPSGCLVEIKNRYGQALEMAYSGEQLYSVTEPVSGKGIYFSYNDQGLVSRVTDTAGRMVSFEYDGKSNLTRITDVSGTATHYEYDTEGRVLKAEEDNKTVFTDIYDEQGRVIYQDDGLADGKNFNFAYDTSRDDRIVTTVTDRTGQTREYTFDRKNNLIALKDPLGETTEYNYDSYGNCTKMTDALGNTTQYSYDARDNLVAVTDPNGNTATMTYDGRDNPTGIYNAGQATNISYNQNNTVSSRTGPMGNTTTYTYNENGQLLSVKGAKGGTTTSTYRNGLPVSITDQTGRIVSYDYDDAGRLTKITNAAGKTTTMAYDAAGNLISITDPLGHTTTYTYDRNGKKTSETDRNGNTTYYKYDDNNNLTEVKDALGNITCYKYDGEGRLEKVTGPRGNTTTFSYDPKGRMVSVTNALGYITGIQYDPVDSVTGVVDALGNKIASTTYDKMKNPKTVTDALGNSWTKEYDPLGRLIKETDPIGQVIGYTYDKLGRVISTIQAGQVRASRVFDEDGNLTEITDPDNNKTTFTYDLAGRLLTKTTASGATVRYEYNETGALAKETNARGQEATYQYDDAGRLIRVTDEAGTISYTYDNNGNVLTITDPAGTITREYDALNRVTKYTDIKGNVIQYQYDRTGNLTGITYPGGKKVDYEYDSCNQLTKVTDWAGRITAYEYDPNGRLVKTTRPDGSVETRTYDKAGRLTEKKDIDKNGKEITSYQYQYNTDGTIAGEQDISPLEPYNPQEKTMTYGPDNRLETYNGQQIEYDADGNMTRGPLKGQMIDFTYDSRNRLIAAGGTEYSYDAANNRISVTENSEQTTYIINPAVLSQALIRTGPNGEKTYYVYGLGLLGQENPGGSYQTYHYDLRGSTVAITGPDGEITDIYQYGPYGELEYHEGETKTPFLYNGRDGVMTDTNGLYYMRARYYNPEIMRFINQDVIPGAITNPLSLNRYAYVNGQPVSLVDPFGLCGEDSGDIGTLAILHNILDIAGLIPGFGEAFDGINALIYFLEGNRSLALVSLLAMVPILGMLATGGKLVIKGGKIGTEVIEKSGYIKRAGKATGQLLNVEKNLFRNFDGHYSKHVVKQGEFGNITPQEYFNKAMDLATTPVNNVNTFSRTLSNGREAIYNVSTNELVIVHDGAQIGTFFKPTNGWDYFVNTLK